MAEGEAEMEEFAAFENEQELFKALGKTPLVKNAFYVRLIADSKFTADGTEGMTPGMSRVTKIAGVI